MALLKCSYPTLASATHASAYSCVSPAPPPACMGVAGEGRRGQGADKKQVHGHTRPPQNLRWPCNACKYFCLCEFGMTEARRNRKRPSCTRHDKRGTEAVEKKSACVSAKMAVSKNKIPLFIFSIDFVFTYCRARFFSIAGVQLLA